LAQCASPRFRAANASGPIREAMNPRRPGRRTQRACSSSRVTAQAQRASISGRTGAGRGGGTSRSSTTFPRLAGSRRRCRISRATLNNSSISASSGVWLGGRRLGLQRRVMRSP
jgi:hypothetical protein